MLLLWILGFLGSDMVVSVKWSCEEARAGEHLIYLQRSPEFGINRFNLSRPEQRNINIIPIDKMFTEYLQCPGLSYEFP